MMNLEEVTAIVRQCVADAEVRIQGVDCEFTVLVISDSFCGLSQLKRQQPVMAAFAPSIKNDRLHALTIKTFTRAEWEALQQPALDQ
jgi:acid stress-induced BolA-like protein IbaG/YrbA